MKNMNYNFENKVAFITGAGSGIGESTARLFAQAGAGVALVDIHPEPIQRLADALNGKGYKAFAIPCNVGNEENVKNAVEKTVEVFGRLDFAFNNAGIQVPTAKTADIETADFERALRINLLGVFYCMKYPIRQMMKQGDGGSIVNVASQDAIVGTATLGAYSAAKTGIIGLAKCTALEYAEQGIRVNMIAPGMIMTPMVEQAIKDYPEHMQDLIDMIPQKRVGTPENIASCALYLCSDDASFMTGQTMTIDGGFTVK